MQIQITGLKELSAKLDALGKKTLRLATNAAIKDTAFQVKDALEAEMKSVFDRPTDWALSTVRIDTSAKESASIGLDWKRWNVRSKWKSPQFAPHNIHGGTRPYKKIERVLRAAGILPQGMYVAPARGAWVDQHGNLAGQEFAQIMKSVGALGDTARLTTPKGKKRSSKQNRYFVMRRGGRAFGIAEKIWGARNIRPVLVFISQPHYKSRFDFYGVARRIAQKNWKENFHKRLEEYRNYIK